MTVPPDPTDASGPHDHATYAEWDAAYVLGSLSTSDRLAYEAHLATCERCRTAVTELAGIPGLLGKVPAAELLSEVDDLPVPATLVPRLPTRRRRRWVPALAAAAAALVVGVGVGFAVRTPPADSVVAASGTTRIAFTSERDIPITAVVDVTPTAQGTKLQVECQYGYRAGETPTGPPPGSTPSGGPSGDPSGDPGREYALYVIDRDGNETDAGSWVARPGVVSHPEAVSPLPYGRIAAVEIRGADGTPTLLRADL